MYKVAINQIPKHIFRTYDIRGNTLTDLSYDLVHDIGVALGSEALSQGVTTIIVARDGRLSSPKLFKALKESLLSTGIKHLDGGAKKVVISAPAKGVDATFVYDVNHESYDPSSHDVVSNASCTTNCIIPLVTVLQENFGVESGYMTTVHAFTNDQSLVDAAHKDPRRARSAPENIIPTSTGAARTAGEIYPELRGRVDGMAMRVPVADGSITDFVAQLSTEVSADQVNDAFKKAASGDMSHILEYSEAPIVSSDIVGNSASCVFDSPLTMANGKTVKVLGWYDNEWGYSNRTVDLVRYIGESL